jgi:hypothetical protein
MRRIVSICLLALAFLACGSYGGGSQPLGGGAQNASPQRTDASPAGSAAPSPSKDMGDDPYYGY